MLPSSAELRPLVGLYPVVSTFVGALQVDAVPVVGVDDRPSSASRGSRIWVRCGRGALGPPCPASSRARRTSCRRSPRSIFGGWRPGRRSHAAASSARSRAPRDGAEERRRRVLGVQPGRNRSSVVEKFIALMGDSFPCDFPVAQRMASCSWHRPFRPTVGCQHLVDRWRHLGDVVAGAYLDGPGEPADLSTLVLFHAVLRLVTAGEVRAVDEQQSALVGLQAA